MSFVCGGAPVKSLNAGLAAGQTWKVGGVFGSTSQYAPIAAGQRQVRRYSSNEFQRYVTANRVPF
jgi:hypothetical protein